MINIQLMTGNNNISLIINRWGNRLKDSLRLFEGSIQNSSNNPIFTGICDWFLQLPIYIVFTKLDIFIDKVRLIKLGDFFSNYTGKW